MTSHTTCHDVTHHVTHFLSGSISGDSAVVSWDELDIEGCVYSLNLTTGRNNISVIEEVEKNPKEIIMDVVPPVNQTAINKANEEATRKIQQEKS